MKFKGKVFKIFALLILGFGAINFVFIGANEAVNPKNAHFIPKCEYLRNTCYLAGVECISSDKTQSSNPKAYLLNFIFNPFFSLLIIAVLLFLMWSNLKTKHRLK